jgi:hypothetical protein
VDIDHVTVWVVEAFAVQLHRGAVVMDDQIRWHRREAIFEWICLTELHLSVDQEIFLMVRILLSLAIVLDLSV